MDIFKNFVQNSRLFSPGESRYLIIGIGAAVGLTALGVTIWYKRLNNIPKKWKRVGELSDLMCFPVKSCAPVRENEFDCNILGVEKGTLRDRRFMLIDLDGQFISGRQQPKLVKVIPIISDNNLHCLQPNLLFILPFVLNNFSKPQKKGFES